MPLKFPIPAFTRQAVACFAQPVLLAALCWLIPAQVLAQVILPDTTIMPTLLPTTPNGVLATGVVLNQYAILASDAVSGSKNITITDVSHFAKTGPTPAYPVSGPFFPTALKAGELLLVIQMQGASINTQNNSNYGNVTNYNNAGNYEFVYVSTTYVSGSANISLQCALKNNYTASGKTQVVRVPVFNNLNIADGAVVTSIPWNYTGPVTRGNVLGNAALSPNLPIIPANGLAFTGSANRGGIVAFQVTGTLNLNTTGKIDVTGHGFRSGIVDGNSSPSGPLIFSYYVSNSTNEGAAKGESIAGYDLELAAFGGAYGRGAPANGGGGGNGHNAAGGGGANGFNGTPRNRGAGIMSTDDIGTTAGSWALAWARDPDFIANGGLITANSGGGRGGYSYSSANADARTVSPSASGWSGDQRDPTGGFGGYALINDPDNRIFFGGGGGAGDNNSGSGERAGHGGGIIYVKANIISGSGSIVADGEDSPPTRCNCGAPPPGIPALGLGNDGASGGGGGGTILLNVGTLANTVSLVATGGDGGDQIINLGNESEGAGGGGGGGYIGANLSLAANPTTVAGGQYGTTNSPALTEFLPNGATSGASGLIEHASLTASSFPIFGALCDQDNDNDNVPDITDVDDDNDGLPDAYDVCPTSATGLMTGTFTFPCLNTILHDAANLGLDPTKDTDGDGVLNYLDKTPVVGGNNTCTDANANGVCDAINVIFDSDRDGVPNFYDLDSDNDGITDLIEAGGVDQNADGIISILFDAIDNRFELDANENGFLAGENTPADEDGDGWIKTYDNNDNGDLGDALTIPDTDGDGLPDFLDLDSDNDGLPDVIEMGGIDGDGNGQPDALTNGDNDGYTDIYDTDIDGVVGKDVALTVNRALVRTDVDGDGDGVPDAYPLGKNSDELVEFPAIILNYRDLDSDADGIPDLVEHRGSDDNGDGKVDNTLDADNDGFADEYDSDDDGVAGIDVGENSDPLIITAFDNNFDGKNTLTTEGFTTGDIDGDRVANSWDLDSDDDGLPDLIEARGFTDSDLDGDPATHISDIDYPLTDGRPDVANTDADNDGWFDDTKADPILTPNLDNVTANGKVDRTEGYASIAGFNPNFDGDIQPDLYDRDSDNDGIFDVDELQPSISGALPNAIGIYTDGWEAGLSGAYSFAPEESGDGEDDYRDINSEGDNSRDWIEGFYDGTNSDEDALVEYKAKAAAWITAICGTHPGCTAYNTTDADADGFPAWLDSHEGNANSNPYPNYNYLPPFLNVSSAFYMDVDEDGVVDLYDRTYGGSQSSEPDDAGSSTQSLLTPNAAGAGSGVPAYRDNLINVTLPIEWDLVELSPNGNHSIIRWQLPNESQLAFYQVERSTTGHQYSFQSLGTKIPAHELAGLLYSYTDSNALSQPNRTLYYRVRAVGINGGGAYSQTLSISTSRQEVHMKAYPNPAHGDLKVETTLLENATLRIVSVIGQTVLALPVAMGTTVQTIPLGNIPPGLYILVLSDGSSQVPVLIQ